MTSAALRRFGPVALCAALVAVFVAWNPQVHDLAAHVFRAELFERSGLAIWNGSWYGGHYTLTYSVLFPPLAALLSPQAVGAISVIAAALLFDSLVRGRWGEQALWGSLWFAIGVAAMYANGNLSFALGCALGLAALYALRSGRSLLAAVLAVGCALASPLAGAFLGGVAIVIALVSVPTRGRALAVALGALLPVLGLNVVFHEEGLQPYDFAAYVALPLWCAGALYLTWRLPGEQAFRVAVAGYALVATAFALIDTPMGSNVSRLGMFFGGPVLLCVLIAHRKDLLPEGPGWRRVLTVAIAVLTLGWGAYWQLDNAVREVALSVDDPSTEESYYAPLEEWLRAHGGDRTRIEIPETTNSWEMAYVAPEFQLARGWLRQMDRARNELFFEGALTAERYREWLMENGVRYVALPDVSAQQYSKAERELIHSQPDFLTPVFESEHWRVWEVEGARPFVSSDDAGVAEVLDLEPESVTLEVARPGTFLVLVRASPFWHVTEGEGCTSTQGEWTEVRAHAPGVLRIESSFSLRRAWNSLARTDPVC